MLNYYKLTFNNIEVKLLKSHQKLLVKLILLSKLKSLRIHGTPLSQSAKSIKVNSVKAMCSLLLEQMSFINNWMMVLLNYKLCLVPDLLDESSRLFPNGKVT